MISFILRLTWVTLLYAVIASPLHAAGSFHGTVVDADTKKPLKGAVVVVVWYRKPIISMDGPQYFHKAIEVLTDAHGKFSVTSKPGIDWNPLTFVLEHPHIVIFKPGYGPYPYEHVKPRDAIVNGQVVRLNWEQELLKGTMVELPKLRNENERTKYRDVNDLRITICRKDERIYCLPATEIPLLINIFGK